MRKGEALTIVMVAGLIASTISASMGLAAFQTVTGSIFGGGGGSGAGDYGPAQESFDALASGINEVCGEEGASDTASIKLEEDESIRIEGQKAILETGEDETDRDLECSVVGETEFDESADGESVAISYESDDEVRLG